MKTLVSNKKSSYVSETLLHNGMKFKVVSSNGNAYSRLEISVYTKNYDLSVIATANDIPGYEYVDYVWSDNVRLALSLKNIKAAKKYIEKVYSE